MAIVTDRVARDVFSLGEDDTLLGLIRPSIENLVTDYVGYDLERATYTRYYPSSEFGGARAYWPGEFGAEPSIGGRSNLIQLHHKFVLASGLVVQEFSGAYSGQFDETDWTTLTLGDEYILDLENANVSETGHIRRLGASWPKQRGSVQVTYTAGFTATELDGRMTGGTDYTNAADIRLAVLQAIGQHYNQMRELRPGKSGVGGPFISETVPDYSYTRDASVARGLFSVGNDLAPGIKQMLFKYKRLGQPS
jgi:hypothetical protein